MLSRKLYNDDNVDDDVLWFVSRGDIRKGMHKAPCCGDW